MYTTNCAPNRDIVISSRRSRAIELLGGTLQQGWVRLLFIYILPFIPRSQDKICLLLSCLSLRISCSHLRLFAFPTSPLSLPNSATKVATTSTTSPAPAMDSPPAQLLSRAVAWIQPIQVDVQVQTPAAKPPPLVPVKFSNGATNASRPLRQQRAP